MKPCIVSKDDQLSRLLIVSVPPTTVALEESTSDWPG